MENHILNISGKRSIGFKGEEIASESNRDSNEQTQFEWDTVRIFRVDPEWARNQERKTGKRISPFRVGVAKCTIWEGEKDRYKVFYSDTLQQVLGIVRSHLPMFLRAIEDQLRLNNTPIGHESSRSPMES